MESCALLVGMSNGTPVMKKQYGGISKIKQRMTICLESILKNRDKSLLTKVSQGYGFSSIHIKMGELDHKEGGAPKN